MIRGRDSDGSVILGITRTEIMGLLEGQRCCFPSRPELGGGPHICLWFGETDDDLTARLGEMFPSGLPAAIKDLRTRAPHEGARALAHDGCNCTSCQAYRAHAERLEHLAERGKEDR
jgi:hypothetical protein